MGHFVVMGAGRSGMASARFLRAGGREVILTDAKPHPDEAVEKLLSLAGIPGVWGLHPQSMLEGCEGLVLSPGVNPRQPFVEEASARGIPVSGELELAHEALRARGDGSRILAVTGTNGKSTTTDLLGHLLRGAGLPAVACGNLGMPLLEALEKAAPGTTFAVECSSYQLETIHGFHAEAAAFLNLTPDHLARHGTMEAYRAAKLRIFERQRASDLRLTPAFDASLDRDAPGEGLPAHFGWGPPKGPGGWCGPDGNLVLVSPAGKVHELLPRSELKIPGDHNVENALAAAVLAHHGGVPIPVLREALMTYPGLAHRIALCGEKAGVRAYNDSKGTNVDATLTAIRALPGPLVLLLGGQDKGASYRPLRAALEGKLKKLVFLGEAIPHLQRDLGDLPHVTVEPFDAAVGLALSLAEAGDQVVLSPACASFDQFRNFEERGDRFEALVKAWAEDGA